MNMHEIFAKIYELKKIIERRDQTIVDEETGQTIGQKIFSDIRLALTEEQFALFNEASRNILVGVDAVEMQARDLMNDHHKLLAISARLLPLVTLANNLEDSKEVEEREERQEIKLALMCGDVENAFLYLYKFSQKHPEIENVFQAACDFKMPNTLSCTWEAWQALANYNNQWKNLIEHHDFRKYLLPFAVKIENAFKSTAKQHQEAFEKTKESKDKELPFLTTDMEPQQIKQLRKAWFHFMQDQTSEDKFKDFLLKCPLSLLKREYAKLLFVGADASPAATEAAIVFHQYDLEQQYFSQYLSLAPKVKDYIPDVGIITGEHIGVPNSKYYLKKLNPRDPRAACLGKITDCCQSMGGADGEGGDGHAIALHIITSPYGGAYVICKKVGKSIKESDPIVSQAWAWISRRSALVLDSIESLKENAQGYSKEGNCKNMDIFVALYKELARVIVDKNNAYNIVKVTIGDKGRTPTMGLACDLHDKDGVFCNEMPIDYDGFRDSHSQMLLATREFPLAELYVLNNILTRTDPVGAKEIAIKNLNSLSNAMIIKIQEILLNYNPVAKDAFGLRLAYAFYDCLDKESKENVQRLYQQHFNGKKSFWWLRAAAQLELKYMQWILQYGAVVLPKGDKLNLILNAAVQSSRIDGVQFLVENNADLECLNQDGCRMLYVAAESAKVEMVRYLLSRGLEVNALNKNDLTALHVATIKNHLSIVECLLLHGAHANAKDSFGNSSLIYAAENGHIEIIASLLDKGANIHLKNNNRHTAVYFAAKKEKWEAVHYLIKAGAHNCIVDDKGRDLFHLATDKSAWLLVQTLMDQEAIVYARDHTILHTAVIAKKWPVVDYFIKQGLDIHAKDWLSETILHVVVRRAEVDKVQYLLDNGANVNAYNTRYQSPFALAAEEKKWDMVQLMLPKADLKCAWKVLYQVVEAGELELLKSIIRTKKPDLRHKRHDDNLNLLQVAERVGQQEIVEFLEPYYKSPTCILSRDLADLNVLVPAVRPLCNYRPQSTAK